MKTTWPNGKPRPKKNKKIAIAITIPNAQKMAEESRRRKQKVSRIMQLLMRKPNANLNEIQKAANQDAREIPKKELKLLIAENKERFNHLKSELAVLAMRKGVDCFMSIDPRRISPNALPIAGGVAISRALDIEKSMPQEEEDPKSPLLALLEENNMTFQDLQHLVISGKRPDSMSLEHWQALQLLLTPTPSNYDPNNILIDNIKPSKSK